MLEWRNSTVYREPGSGRLFGKSWPVSVGDRARVTPEGAWWGIGPECAGTVTGILVFERGPEDDPRGVEIQWDGTERVELVHATFVQREREVLGRTYEVKANDRKKHVLRSIESAIPLKNFVVSRMEKACQVLLQLDELLVPVDVRNASEKGEANAGS